MPLVNGKELKLSKKDLNLFATILGIVGGISLVLGGNDVIPQKIANSIAGICTILSGYLVQKPADAHPTTEELENKLIKKND